MPNDATALRDFYASPLGQLARRIIAHRLRERWENVAGTDVIGLGYASPFLRIFAGEARSTVALMPEAQGVVQWPHKGPYRSALVAETQLPLRDMSVEHVLVVHGLEHAGSRQDYLKEIWRVLMPEGRVIIVVPNRRGAWARLETTPFGQGRPYSLSQIQGLMLEAEFEPLGMTPCLFAPPLRARALPSAALAWERIGVRFWPAFAGVLIVEAIKHVHAGIKVPVKKPAFIPIPLLGGLRPAAHR